MNERHLIRVLCFGSTYLFNRSLLPAAFAYSVICHGVSTEYRFELHFHFVRRLRSSIKVHIVFKGVSVRLSLWPYCVKFNAWNVRSSFVRFFVVLRCTRFCGPNESCERFYSGGFTISLEFARAAGHRVMPQTRNESVQSENSSRNSLAKTGTGEAAQAHCAVLSFMLQSSIATGTAVDVRQRSTFHSNARFFVQTIFAISTKARPSHFMRNAECVCVCVRAQVSGMMKEYKLDYYVAINRSWLHLLRFMCMLCVARYLISSGSISFNVCLSICPFEGETYFHEQKYHHGYLDMNALPALHLKLTHTAHTHTHHAAKSSLSARHIKWNFISARDAESPVSLSFFHLNFSLYFFAKLLPVNFVVGTDVMERNLISFALCARAIRTMQFCLSHIRFALCAQSGSFKWVIFVLRQHPTISTKSRVSHRFCTLLLLSPCNRPTIQLGTFYGDTTALPVIASDHLQWHLISSDIQHPIAECFCTFTWGTRIQHYSRFKRILKCDEGDEWARAGASNTSIPRNVESCESD